MLSFISPMLCAHLIFAAFFTYSLILKESCWERSPSGLFASSRNGMWGRQAMTVWKAGRRYGPVCGEETLFLWRALPLHPPFPLADGSGTG